MKEFLLSVEERKKPELPPPPPPPQSPDPPCNRELSRWPRRDVRAGRPAGQKMEREGDEAARAAVPVAGALFIPSASRDPSRLLFTPLPR